MKHVKLGRTGLEVSRICVGCMSFGEPTRGNHAWTLPEDESRALIKQALDAGITFFDTANVYSLGSSEEILGRALSAMTRREDVVIATKVHGQMRPGPNGGGLGRKAILHEVDASLTRLDTDFIDLLQIHRWDPTVPLEETLEALDSLVRAGKVRYLGASSMWAWQLSKALYTSDAHGWARFVTMQGHYNLLNREEEREMLPLCADQGLGVIPWSPLARGRLARPWATSTARSETDEFGKTLYDPSDKAIVDVLETIALERGVPMAQVALAWMLTKPGIHSPIVGATKAQHLTDAVAAVDLQLTSDEVARLEKPYIPHETAGFA